MYSAAFCIYESPLFLLRTNYAIIEDIRGLKEVFLEVKTKSSLAFLLVLRESFGIWSASNV